MRGPVGVPRAVLDANQPTVRHQKGYREPVARFSLQMAISQGAQGVPSGSTCATPSCESRAGRWRPFESQPREANGHRQRAPRLRPRADRWCLAGAGHSVGMTTIPAGPVGAPGRAHSNGGGCFDPSRGHLRGSSHAETAWLSGSGVPGMPGMRVRCLPGCLPQKLPALLTASRTAGRRGLAPPPGRLQAARRRTSASDASGPGQCLRTSGSPPPRRRLRRTSATITASSSRPATGMKSGTRSKGNAR
jgi:hypothetical protein